MSAVAPEISATEAALHRVSKRKYTDRQIPRGELEQILVAAGAAPSAFNLQPWRVKVVTDQDVKNKLMAAAYNQPQVGGASAVFVVYSDIQDTLSNVEEIVHPGMRDRLEQVVGMIQGSYGSLSTADQNNAANAQTNIFLGYLLLILESRGWASSPMLGFEPPKVRELFGLKEDAPIAALVAVGEGAEEGFGQHRHKLERFVEFI